MERPVMFMQSLLVLVVAIHVISACMCGKKSTMEEAICMKGSFMMGTPRSVEFTDARGNPVTNPEEPALAKYNVYLNAMYQQFAYMQCVAVNIMSYTGTMEYDGHVLLTDYHEPTQIPHIKRIRSTQEGLHKMGEHHELVLLTARKAENCGVEFQVGTNYFISGSTLNTTHLLIHSCNYAERVPWDEKTHDELETINDLLNGQTELDCTNTCTIVGPYGVLIPC